MCKLILSQEADRLTGRGCREVVEDSWTNSSQTTSKTDTHKPLLKMATDTTDLMPYNAKD
jgi:hypothetical protein